jgi:DNA adenine methylase
VRYVGGKKKIANYMVDVIDQFRKPGQWVWEPFCGGLGVTGALSKHGPVWATDACAPLIQLYQSVRQGWVPPSELSKEQWLAAKSLPDSDPMKAFCGFGCSYRGVWFSGYAGGYVGPSSRFGALAASEVVRKDAVVPAAVDLVDFLSVEPEPQDFVLYCDPPYRGTVGYDAVGGFDHDLFEWRVAQWSAHVDVFVSEYAFPFGEVVWSKSRARMLSAGHNNADNARATEKLFLIRKGSLEIERTRDSA